MNNPDGFFLDSKNVLFFNIFIKNNKLYLITPLHKCDKINKSTIKVMYNSQALNCVQQITKAKYEATQILIYNFETPKNKTYKIEVLFGTKTKTFNLKHMETKKNKKLALTTLFKTDYKLNTVFYDYYKNQGVQHFYMYYNGKITDEIRKYYSKEDITLIEWDYTYWNVDSAHSFHYAQLGQMHDAIYRFGKDNCEYMIFCDLDEYLYLGKNKRLIDLVSNTSVDTYGFRNIWANTKDHKVPARFPNEFYVAKNKHRYGDKSKCIHKMDAVAHIGIHSANGSEVKKHLSLKDEYTMYHFHSWGGANIGREDTPVVTRI